MPRLDLRYRMPIPPQVRSTSPHPPARGVQHLLDDLAPAERTPLELVGPFDIVPHAYVSVDLWLSHVCPRHVTCH
jgi:hypothetical protein